MDYNKGTFKRTVRKFLSMAEPDVAFAVIYLGKMLTGHASKHRTRSGVKYNKLILLHRRLHPAEFAPPNTHWEEADDMCPNCVTPWKCNGPHITQ